MKKVLILSALLVALALPSFAYQINWSENFDSFAAGNLIGKTDWTGNAWQGQNVQIVTNQRLSFNNSIKSNASATAWSAHKVNGVGMYRGRMTAWMYDGGGVGYTKVGVNASNYTGVQEQRTTGVSTALYGNQPAFWAVNWNYTNVVLDGTSGNSTGVGWSFTQAQDFNPDDGMFYRRPKPRTTGWHYVQMYFGYEGPKGAPTSFWAKWFIDIEPQDEFLSGEDISLTVTNQAGTRWTPLSGGSMSWVYQGYNAGSGTPVNLYVDNMTLSGDPVPEPGSLLALGTGLIGLAGLIRRKR